MVFLTYMPGDFPSASRRAWERRAGRALLCLALRRRGWGEIEDIESILGKGPQGKPFLKTGGLHFNISHSGGAAACAVEDCPVGLDLQTERSFTPSLAARIMAPGEEELVRRAPNADDALTQLWTCKESWMKLTGLGFSQGIKESAFTALGDCPRPAGEGPCFRSQKLPGFWLTEACPQPFLLEVEVVELPGE